MADKACDGGRVLDDGDMAECPECGARVRWDLQDHPFFGWAARGCPWSRHAGRSDTPQPSGDA